MEGIRQYVAKARQQTTTLSDASFLTSTAGITVSDLLSGTGIQYRYNGAEQPLTDILSQLDCSRVFLLLGLNDLSAADPSVDDIVDKYSQLIDLIQESAPGAEVIVITNPPKVAGSWLPNYTINRDFNNALIDQFVGALIDMCAERGAPYLDAHALIQDENGAMPDSLCRDGFLHLNDAGAKMIVDALYDFAEGRL